MLKFINPFAPEDILKAVLHENRYLDRDRLYLGLLTWNEEFRGYEPWCDITVNLQREELTDENCAFLDVNNAPYLEKFIQDNHLGRPTGRRAQSGYVTYPEYRFNPEEIRKHTHNPELN